MVTHVYHDGQEIAFLQAWIRWIPFVSERLIDFERLEGRGGFLGPDHPDPRFLVLRLLRGALFVQLPIYRSASLAPSCASWREHWTAFFLRPP